MVALRDNIPGTITPTLRERRFYCQNWRHDVVKLLDSSGGRAEGYRSSAYAVPFGIPKADINGDGTVDSTDNDLLTAAFGSSLGDPGYVMTADINLDVAEGELHTRPVFFEHEEIGNHRDLLASAAPARSVPL